jgi:hypothetical protein
MRKPVFLLILVALTSVGQVGYAQKKVKYKDIWALLNNKQYETAEPFLKSYLAENTDNPNAYLYMGLIYQEKSLKDDILRATALTIGHMDSSIFFLNKAYAGINEKEIKKNDEFYQSFSRRDLRTGEFGIKLSDIQFDIEKRVEGLREKIDRVKMVKHYFVLSDTLYKKCTAAYKAMLGPFEEEKQFLLRAEKSTVEDLKTLSLRFDSSMKAFDQYRASTGTVGKTGYNQIIVRDEIKTFKTDGTSAADFYQNDLHVWDYKAWAEAKRHSIEDDILVIREHLVSYDQEINKLRDKINGDTVSVKNDLTKLIDRLLLEQLRKYDENPLPMALFAVKIADLDYKSLIIEHGKYADSLDLRRQLVLAKEEATSARKLDSLATQILGRDFERECENYTYFINSTYSNTTVLKSYLKVMKDFSSRESENKQNLVVEIENSMRWMVVNNDSIPLNVGLANASFQPLMVESEKFTTGLNFRDSVHTIAYFYTITPSRVPDVKITFPVDGTHFKKADVPNTKSLAYSDPAGQVFYVLLYNVQLTPEKKCKATLAKIYRSDGLAWSSNIDLAFIPKELSYATSSGEFVIRADGSESVVDKNGKVLR